MSSESITQTSTESEVAQPSEDQLETAVIAQAIVDQNLAELSAAQQVQQSVATLEVLIVALAESVSKMEITQGKLVSLLTQPEAVEQTMQVAETNQELSSPLHQESDDNQRRSHHHPMW